ncbi:MAG: hypothetical protein ACX98W_14170 [bacterium]
MHARSILTHLVTALLAFGLGWLVFGAPDTPVDREASSLPESPAMALAAILELDDPSDRAVRLVRFFEQTDPSAAIVLRDVLIDQQEKGLVDEMAELLFASWWARSDPEAAFANIVDPGWANRHPWVRAVFREWVHQDPTAAAAAVESLPAEAARGRLEAARVVIDEWFELEDVPDPSRLLGLIEQLEIRRRAFAIQRVLNALVEQRGVDATQSFVEAVPESGSTFDYDLRQELMARMAVVLLDHDVERAVRWAEEHGHDRQGAGIRKHLAYYWGLKDGPAAMEWATGLPDTPDRSAVVARAWLSFGRVQPEKASDWLVERGPDGALQDVYARYLRNLAKNEPARALELAEQTADDEVREKMLMAVGQGWMRADREAAEAWLATAGLPPEIEKRIRRASRRPTRPERNAG